MFPEASKRTRPERRVAKLRLRADHDRFQRPLGFLLAPGGDKQQSRDEKQAKSAAHGGGFTRNVAFSKHLDISFPLYY
jgi:hypothetical protein